MKLAAVAVIVLGGGKAVKYAPLYSSARISGNAPIDWPPMSSETSGNDVAWSMAVEAWEVRCKFPLENILKPTYLGVCNIGNQSGLCPIPCLPKVALG